MNFTVIEPGLRVIFDGLSGIPGQITQQDKQAFFVPQIGPGAPSAESGDGSSTLAILTYSIFNVRSLAFDERRKTYDPSQQPAGDTYAGPGAPLGGIIYESTGDRQFTVQLKCECADGRDGAGAIAILERIRTRLRLPSTRDALDLLEIAIAEIRATQDLSYTNPDDGRAVQAAAFEIVFNAADSALDAPITTIEVFGDPAATIS